LKPTITKPNFLHLFRDYILFQAAFSAVFGFGLGTYLYFDEPEIYISLLFFGFGLIALFGLVWRSLWILRLYNIGDIIEATVVQVRFNQFNHRGMGQIKLTYEYQREQYSKAFAIVKSRTTNQLAAGAKVSLLIDPEHPKRVSLKFLFD
jgi:hypothetical protein